MATTERGSETTKSGRIREALAAKVELGEALAQVGVVLPSLRLDPVSLTGDHLSPLLDLGRCTPAAARRMAGALRGEPDITAKVREVNRQSLNRP